MKDEIILRVKEALVKDVGRAIARIDPNDMKLLGLESGDVIVIEGKRATPVKIMPCYPEDRDKGIIQIDGITRENAQAGIDEKVKVVKTTCRQAIKIKLKPETKTGSLKADDAKYIGSLINGLSVVKGDKVRANLFGSRSIDYTVTGTSPEGVVLIQPNTSFQLELTKQDAERKHKVSYEDIGGLGNQVQRIREMIELPLKYPEIFERLGVQPPKGVFLYGPPGTGKTLIVRAVAHETDAYFINISGPEIMGKFYGESEGRIRKIFEEAQQHAPAIIFIDEIDAIAPKREDMGGEKQVEKRVVAQLLSLMDGLESRGKVIVIGATNIPNSIDPALRRPGRFDREISISIPDKKGRLEILHIHTRGIPLSLDVDMEKLAEITHGFVGADLEALAREAAMTALRKILPQIDFEMSEIPYELLMSLEVSMDNFMDAMKEVEPSAIREVFVEVPDVKWDDVGGLEEIKEALKETVEWP
ncbi:MAG: AAA family ATPase, partial [Bacteroidales bacterium]